MIIPNINDCFSEDCPRDWPEDFTMENGFYGNNCCKCKRSFFGHKRRVMCKECFNPFTKHTHAGSEEIIIVGKDGAGTAVQTAFAIANIELHAIAYMLQQMESQEAKERGQKLARALNTSDAAILFTEVPRLLDKINHAEARSKRIEQRLRVLWINKLTLGLTHNQRKELRSLSAL